MSWAIEEFETINLGDKRLNRRAVLLAERLAENPSSSIPGACKGWKETLGVIDTWQWAREFRHEDGERNSEIIESQRWIDGYERVAETAASLPDTRCVYLADREADIVGLMYRAAELDHPADWLIRSKHNRVLPDGAKLWPTVRQEKALGEVQFELRARRGVKARSVRQTVHVKTLEIPNGKKGKNKGTLSITCLVASEVGTPKGKKSVEWPLVTNRPVSTLTDAVQLIDWYRARWEIEMFFDILKNACKVEKLQLSTLDRLQTAIALFLVVAWRINRLMRLGRECPDMEASLVFEREEWVAAYVLNKMKPPESTPTINEVVRLIAKLGGFLGRKSDGEPGVKTLWRGLEQIATFSAGMQFAQAQADNPSTCV